RISNTKGVFVEFNIFMLVILFTLAADFILNRTSDFLTLKHLSPTVPNEFTEIIDGETYAKTISYTRTKTNFGILHALYDLLLLLVFWFAAGFNHLDTFVRSLSSYFIWQGLLFIGLLLFFRFLLELPFSIYATFVIEQKAGFNKTTPATFVTDTVKGLLLSVLIGAPLLAGILAFFNYAGTYGWLYCWLTTIAFTTVLQYVAPAWILPLFNTFTPLPDGELKNEILHYSETIRYPLAGIFVMDGSKRSTKSNAFFTGFGKNKKIALFDTLIKNHTVDELVAILGHEIGHFKKKHILTMQIIAIFQMGVLFYLLSLFLTSQGLYDAFFMANQPLYAGFLFFSLLFTPFNLFLSLIINHISRSHEYEADRFAVQTTGKVEPFINALKKLSMHNLSNLTPHPFSVFLHYSHPPVLERLVAMRLAAVLRQKPY
ncbi:MAG: M48 family metallopeptidase, partial [Chitinivibrionales bacterium]|nr:M48 family metallopeptidase [Chitinivibrionales bacterium]